jgi:Abnormal spindle-like microcephaly-assoc'd, ASPM-SPD-2-Hydin/Galactose oxidase, central domain/Kelch motif
MLDGIAGRFMQLRKISRKILRPTFLFALLFTVAAASARAQADTFVATGNLVTSPRYQHTATLLSNGTVLITGGLTASATTPPTISTLASAELYDSTTLAFAATGNMTTSRYSHTATLLNNGQVLISGGAGDNGAELASVELYDPATGIFTATGSMSTGRAAHTATLLGNGKVLIAGGYDSSGIPSTSAELYDATTGVFTPTGSMSTPRESHTAALLSNGKVLIAGGGNSTSGELASAELYDPSTGTFSATGSMTDPRNSHTATLLNNGKVLVAGGYGTMPTCSTAPVLNTAELYDPTTGTFTATGSMNIPRFNHTATLLNNNLVLVAAGDSGPRYNLECNPVVFNPRILASAELYDPTAGTFASTANLIAERELHTATLLNDGTVLIAGGSDLQDNLPPPNPSAELYKTSFASVLPPFLSFGSQAVGTTSSIGQTVTLKNSDGSSALNITQVTINGVNSSDFAETDSCLGSIAIGASCTITVTFTPGAAGTRTGNLVIVNNNNSSSSLKVPLSGSGFVGQPAVSLSPNMLVFSAAAVGTSSPPQMATLANSGTAALNIQTVAVSGGSDFVIASGTTCTNGDFVAVGGSCVIQVAFSPTTPGQKSAAVTITDNVGGSPQQISLAGTSISAALSLSPASVSFPSQFVGTSGLPQTLTVTNTGNVTLTITAVTASAADFGVLSNCTNPVAPGLNCTIGVFFSPTAGGTRTGTLKITDNAGNSPQAVALTGSGLDFSMTPGSAASATVTAGQSASYSIAVAPAGGFAANVALSCSGGPAGSACAVSPSTIALSGAAAQTAMVTVTTAAHGWLLPFRGGWPRDARYRQTPMILALVAMFLLMVVASQFLRREQNLAWIRVVGFAALVTLGLTLTSCGGGSGSGGGGTNPQAGTYTVTVTGNFTSGSTTLTHAAKLTLVVQ